MFRTLARRLAAAALTGWFVVATSAADSFCPCHAHAAASPAHAMAGHPADCARHGWPAPDHRPDARGHGSSCLHHCCGAWRVAAPQLGATPVFVPGAIIVRPMPSTGIDFLSDPHLLLPFPTGPPSDRRLA
ncbi:MAG TPA: hypothetical protein VLV16_00490 [Gemmatimonadales bacterium]|nr:hypothetical protein [Gemmatimonadales bacterium]